jgi:CRISPR-associated protein Csm1
MSDLLMKSSLVGLAAFLHDIGKPYQRTGNTLPKHYSSGSDNWQIFLNRDSHFHALHTANFFESFIENSFIDSLWKEYFPDLSIQKASAGHHNPQDFLTKIIADADQIASGFDRERYEERQNKSKKAYRQVHLTPLLRLITLKEKIPNTDYRYTLDPLNYDSIFPVKKQDITDVKAEEKYKNLIKNFEKDYQKISKEQNLKIYTDALQSLFEKYFSFVPASTWDEYDEVSLFDHSKTTAAFASASYNYLEENNLKEIPNNDDERFIIIRGEFFGIQKFIFGSSTESSKNSAKVLRGKSFYVSMLSEIAAQYFLKELNLPIFNLMLNAAGMFVIVAPNTKQTLEIINNLKEELNKWLYNEFIGEVALGIVTTKSKPSDFTEKRFEDIWLKLLSGLEEEKYSKFNLPKQQALFQGFHEQFDKGNICKTCGKKAADGDNCSLCSLFQDLGKDLVNNRFIYVMDKPDGNIFNKFTLNFSDKFEPKADIFKVIDMYPSKSFEGAPMLYLNNYVPKELNTPKTFEEMVKTNNNSYKPLAVLKADVDNLGAIFACGLEPYKHDSETNYKLTFSRISAMSRMMNMFFAYYIPHLCSKNYENIYTVFAGGDDLFLIGPYEEIIDFNLRIQDEFKKFTGLNKEITLSSAISVFKHNTPVAYMAEIVEDSLNNSKKYGKDSFDKGYMTILSATCKLDEYLDFNKSFDDIFTGKIKGITTDSNRTFWYKILSLLDMRKSLNKLSNIMWIPRLKYLMARTIKENEARTKSTEFLYNAINDKPELLRTIITINLYKQRYGG